MAGSRAPTSYKLLHNEMPHTRKLSSCLGYRARLTTVYGRQRRSIPIVARILLHHRTGSRCPLPRSDSPSSCIYAPQAYANCLSA
ncbi:hypothetical protein J6590_003526 [Homalodisca vitripennis]|nr:hypothetical protein J6590_003526 [Homalodisca vitripennis]